MSANIDQNKDQLALTSLQSGSLNQVMTEDTKKQHTELAHLLTLVQLLEQMKEKANEPDNTKALNLKKPEISAETVQPVNVQSPALPDLPPDLGNDMAAWFQAMERYNEILQEIKALGKDKNVHNMSLFIMEFMSLNMEKGGAQIAQLSAADNVASDVRNMVGNALNQFNAVAGGSSKDPNLAAEAKKFMDIINSLESFLKYEGDLPKNKQVLSSAASKQLLDAINTLKEPFTHFEGSQNIWNNPTAVAKVIQAMGNASSGKYAPQYKDIMDAFNTLNQSVSAFSTSTNTSLQFQTQNFKQMMGIEEAEIQSTQSMTSTNVRNQRSN